MRNLFLLLLIIPLSSCSGKELGWFILSPNNIEGLTNLKFLISGFTTTTITFNVALDKKLIDPESTNDKKVISSARWRKITRDSIYNVLNDMSLVMNG